MTQHEGNAEIARRLRRAREAAGLTQAELGVLVDRARYQIWRIETGRITPTPLLVGKLSRALGVKPSDLTGDREVAA